MAIDTSIYSRVGTGGDIGQIGDAWTQGVMQKRKLRLSDLQLSEAERAAAQGKAVNQAYSGNIGADGTINRTGMINQLASSGQGGAIPGLQKSWADQDKAATEASAKKLEMAKKQLDYFNGSMSGLLALPEITDDALIRATSDAVNRGFLGQDQAIAFVRGMPADQKARRAMLMSGVMQSTDASKQLEALLPKVQAQNLGGTTQMVDTNPLTNPAVVGQTLQRTATPGEVESARHNAIAESNMVRGQNMTDARARDFNQTKVEENKLKREAKEDAANQAKANQLASFDTMMGTLDRLSKHPGLARSVGFTGAFPTFPGSDSANFKAELETFKSQAFIPMVSQLKGMGALSDAEGKKLSAAVGALDSTMSEDAFRESIGTIIKDMKAARDRMAGAPKTAGNPPPPDLAGLEAEMRRRGLLK